MRNIVHNRIIEMTHLDGSFRDVGRFESLVRLMWAHVEARHPQHAQPKYPFRSKVPKNEECTKFFAEYDWAALTDEQMVDLLIVAAARRFTQR